MIALLLGASLARSANSARASDLQRSTDEAAVEAKRDLCIALNRGHDSSQLQEKFFAFYKGEIVSARPLDPDTFATGQVGPLPPFRVVQVLGPNEMLAAIDSGIFKLREVSTADVADDQIIRLTEFFSVRTTETYNTVGGSTNTVYVLEPTKDRMPAVTPSRVYPWYNRKNEVVVVGEFRAIDGSRAVFVVNGQESSVPLTKFTRGDRDLMRLIMDRYPQKKPKAEPAEEPTAQPLGIN